MKMKRVTVCLEEWQVEALKQIAREHRKKHGKTVPWSSVLRRAITFFCYRANHDRAEFELKLPEFDLNVPDPPEFKPITDGRRGRKMPSRKKTPGMLGVADVGNEVPPQDSSADRERDR